MYRLMVALKPTRVMPVDGGFNDGLNFGNVATDNREGRTGNYDRGRKTECWNCGGYHLKSNLPKL